MNAPSYAAPDIAEPSETAVDDLAFISQFADVIDEPRPATISSTSSISLQNDRPIVPVPKTSAPVPSARPRKASGSSTPDSEDEIEEFLTGSTPTKRAVVADKENKPDTEIADAESSSSSSDLSSESDVDTDPSHPNRASRRIAKKKISDRRHAKLSSELEGLTSDAPSQPAMVHIPVPMSESDSSEEDEDGVEGLVTSGLSSSKNHKKQSATNSNGLDGEDEQPITSSFFASKHEISEPPIPIIDINEIGPDERMEAVGSIMSVVGTAVIVQAAFGNGHGTHRVLDTGSLLVFEDRKVLGAVFEAFGPVMKPMYIVRLPSPSITSDASTSATTTPPTPFSPSTSFLTNITPGAQVFCVPDRSTFLFTSALRQIKGSDASNVYDEEVDDREMEFSDDEDEKAHKKMLENMRKERAHANSSTDSKSSFYPKQSQSSTSALPSDDVTDIFYGEAYDDPPPSSVKVAGPSTVPPSIMDLDPRAGRSAPSAYDEVSPYDDPPPPPPLLASEAIPPPSPISPFPPPARAQSSSRGRGGDARGRGQGSRGRGRGRGRGADSGNGRPRTSSRGSMSRSFSGADGAEYDPRNPELARDQRELSPTSAAIARVTGAGSSTGNWDAGANGGTMNSPNQYPHQQQQQQQGYNDLFGAGDGGQYDPNNFAMNMGYGMGMGGMSGYVAPHINPRFAAGMGIGMGGMNLQQQQQMFMQMQPYMGMGMNGGYPEYSGVAAGGQWGDYSSGAVTGGGDGPDPSTTEGGGDGDTRMGMGIDGDTS